MYKVFFNNSFLVIANPDYIDNSANSFPFERIGQLEEWVKEAETTSGAIHRVCKTENPGKIWQQFCAQFKIIEAAGGLVCNTQQQYLCIFRRGSWDLPKGKIDKGETPEMAAIREVREETGLKDIELNEHITDTFHIYRLKGRLVLKRTYWYGMKNDGKSELVPQAEEDIEEALWLHPKEIQPLLANMFGSVKDVLSKAGIVG